MSKNRHYRSNPVAEEVEAPVVEAEVETEPEVFKPKTGKVAGCRMLNVRSEPDVFASIVCTLAEGTEVEVNEDESANDFYKICTTAGVEGFSMKRFITIQ